MASFAAAAAAGGGSSEEAFHYAAAHPAKLNINDLRPGTGHAALKTVKLIDKAYAEKIMEKLMQTGRFSSWDDVASIKGIGYGERLAELKKTFDIMKPAARPAVEDSRAQKSANIRDQKNHGTCYAHAIARSLNRTLRVLGVAKNPEKMYNTILKVAIKIGDEQEHDGGLDGADTYKVAEKILDHELATVFIPPDLRPFLRAELLKSTNWQKLKKALCEYHREPVGDIAMYKSQFHEVFQANTCGGRFGTNDLVASVIEKRHVPPREHGETKIARHSVVLTSYDEEKKTWRFKNSWGAKWGLDGHFVLKSLMALEVDGLAEEYPYIDFAFDLADLPTKYREAFERFDHSEENFEPVMEQNDFNSLTRDDMFLNRVLSEALIEKIMVAKGRGGPFSSWGDLEARVVGLGEKKIQRLIDAGFVITSRAHAAGAGGGAGGEDGDIVRMIDKLSI